MAIYDLVDKDENMRCMMNDIREHCLGWAIVITSGVKNWGTDKEGNRVTGVQVEYFELEFASQEELYV